VSAGIAGVQTKVGCPAWTATAPWFSCRPPSKWSSPGAWCTRPSR